MKIDARLFIDSLKNHSNIGKDIVAEIRQKLDWCKLHKVVLTQEHDLQPSETNAEIHVYLFSK